MRKLLTLIGFFLITPIFLGSVIAYSSYLSYTKSHHGGAVLGEAPTITYAAVPITQDITFAEVIPEDARTEMVRQFFERYRSPLEPFAQNVVTAADQYGIDFRYIPAIAMQESTLCKKEIPGTFNCWGFGIYGKKITSFDSYAQAIDIVTKTLAKEYKSKGLKTPAEIQTLYNPTNHNNWSQAVTGFMAQLQ